MTSSPNSRKFYRTHISLVEKSLGAGIILLLVVIAVTIAIKGNRYDPSRYTGDAGALEFTREAVTGIASTIRNEADLRASEQVAFTSNTSGDSASETLEPTVAGLVPMGPTEHYNTDTLYEKINGRAPAYMEYNFQELTTRSFMVEGATGEFIDVYLFRMDSPLNAFGIFSSERDSSSSPIDFAQDGYESEMGYFLRHGDVYIQTLASSTNPTVMGLARKFTASLVGSMPANDSGLEGKAFLPANGQIPGSLTYINDNAYGQASLSEVFEARYLFDNQELTYFVKNCADADEAGEILSGIIDFYNNYGSDPETVSVSGKDIFIANLFGQWAALYTTGNILTGVINGPDRELSIKFVQTQMDASSTVSDELYNEEEF